MILPNGVYFDEEQQPVRQLVPNRKIRPRMRSTFHALCPACGWKKSQAGFMRSLYREAEGHVCENPLR